MSGDEVTFRFRSKNRKLVRRTIRDERLALGVRELLELPQGSRLFRFEREGELYALTSPLLNAYLAEHLGNGFTAKDFRTWGGTLGSALELEQRGPPAGEDEAKRAVAAVMRKVASELRNTPAVARDSYVSPVVVSAYRDGVTLAAFRHEDGGGRSRLDADERALLALLRARDEQAEDE